MTELNHRPMEAIRRRWRLKGQMRTLVIENWTLTVAIADLQAKIEAGGDTRKLAVRRDQLLEQMSVKVESYNKLEQQYKEAGSVISSR